jgi:hypothetical protein
MGGIIKGITFVCQNIMQFISEQLLFCYYFNNISFIPKLVQKNAGTSRKLKASKSMEEIHPKTVEANTDLRHRINSPSKDIVISRINNPNIPIRATRSQLDLTLCDLTIRKCFNKKARKLKIFEKSKIFIKKILSMENVIKQSIDYERLKTVVLSEVDKEQFNLQPKLNLKKLEAIVNGGNRKDKRLN